MFCKGIGSFKIFPFVVLEQEHHINGRQDSGTKQVSQTYVVYSFQRNTENIAVVPLSSMRMLFNLRHAAFRAF